MPTVRTNDIETYYERRGSGPPIVFVHGAVLDHTQWKPQIDALDEEYTTIAYDVRGHGRTGGSTRETYSIDLFASDLDALVTEFDLDKPVLCGHSTGGCIAQAYAARHSDRLSGLVLADTFTPALYNWREWLQRSAMLRATIPPVRLIGYERVERMMVWIQQQFAGEGVSGDYEKIERIREAGPKVETDEFAKVIRAVANFNETTIHFSAIRVPTLVLYGENDPLFIRRHASKMNATLQHAFVREVPAAGHAANLDNPEFFTASMREFLSQHVPRNLSDAAAEGGE